ncbi:membrane cofactor protein-like isoform X1 [Saccopteryx bilineata]|uniref:membrane cofactor protein-like isoform X1 n=1 Tax=Saccopteryx bilineata TaxID=59482 RepID=UPI00338E82FA
MLTVCQFSIDIRKMTVSPKPRRAPSYHLESLFSSWRFVGIHLVTLVLLLPLGSDACDVPPRFQSMMLRGASQTVYQPGDTVEYECRLGYMRIVPLVSTTAVCQADNTWTPLQEACTKKSCVNLAEPRNGQVTYVNGSTTFGSQAHYECNEGRNLRKKKLRDLLKLKKPVSLGTGTQIQSEILCQPPKKIPHGTYTNSQKDTYEYNEVVTYSCNPSNGPDEYSLVGKRTLICSGQDQWSSDPPECNVVKCPYPVVKNGTIVSIIGTKYSYRTRVTFQCLKGFLFEGSNSAVCGANSNWVPGLPKCTQGVQPTVPKTTPVSSKPGVKPTLPKTTTPGLSTSSAERFEYLDACDDPPRFQSMMLKDPPQTAYQPEDRVEYECRRGYKPIVPPLSTTIVCQADNTWTSLQEACTMVQCPHPVVKNGRIVSIIETQYSYRTRVTFQCLKGFLFEGSNSAVCGANSTWVPGLPKCTQGVKPTVPKTTPVSSKPGVKPTVPKRTKPGHYKSSAERFEYLGDRLRALTVLMFLALQ